jgi:hypothetical protein
MLTAIEPGTLIRELFLLSRVLDSPNFLSCKER